MNIIEIQNYSADQIKHVLKKEEKIYLFKNLLLSTNRKGIEKLIEFLETNTDFFSAPASNKYHSNYDNGLLDHSLIVYFTAQKYKEILINSREDIEDKLLNESIIIVGLLHDICKIGFYKKVVKFRKNSQDKWENYYGYDFEDLFPIGHGEKSVIMLQNFGVELTAPEMLAIRYHMGMWENNNTLSGSYVTAIEKFPLISLFQIADYSSSLLLEDVIVQPAIN